MTEVAAADSTGRTALRWFAGALVAAPLGIVPHELGHYLVLLAVGVPDLTLHFVGVTGDLEEFWEAVVREDYASAAAIAPLWGVAMGEAAGPLVTYALVLTCCYGCAIWRPHPALVAVAYFAQARINVAATHVFRRLFNDELPRSLRRRRFTARNGSSAHDLSHVSGQRRRSAARGRFSVVGGQRAKFGPRGPQGPPETATRVDLSPLRAS